jgi:molybdopterin molybdotransferase
VNVASTSPAGRGRGDLVAYDTYLASILAQVGPLPMVRVPTVPRGDFDPAGLCTASAVPAVWNAPLFTNAAMDGFACAVADLVDDGDGRATLVVSGDIAAGTTGEWTAGTAVRIMTGAPLPEGVDTVVPVEHTDQPLARAPLPAQVRVPADWTAGIHVRVEGSDVAAGQELIPAGTRLDGAALAALAGSGVFSVAVHPRPKVGVIVTGDELLSLDDVSIAGGSMPPGKILNSNATLVTETLRSFGVEVVSVETCSDAPDDFDTSLVRAHQAGVDCIVTTGGASVGAHDVARHVLGDLGVTFSSVAIQPGRPQGFGVVDGVAVCALPGNPGAVHASLHVIVRPVLARLAGGSVPAPVPMPVSEGWSAKTGMRQFVPVIIEEGAIRPVVAGGVTSHRVRSLARADGLAVVAPDVDAVTPGDTIDVIITRPV